MPTSHPQKPGRLHFSQWLGHTLAEAHGTSHQEPIEGGKKTLHALTEDPFITIKEADNRGADHQLVDCKFYLPGDEDQTQDSIQETDHLQMCIWQGQYQTTQDTGFLPQSKIHKANTNLGTPLGRPIISGNGCTAEKISALVDLCINPLVPLIPSYVKDSKHTFYVSCKTT